MNFQKLLLIFGASFNNLIPKYLFQLHYFLIILQVVLNSLIPFLQVFPELLLDLFFQLQFFYLTSIVLDIVDQLEIRKRTLPRHMRIHIQF